ncbi:MAG TPA: metallophosphoesterase [Blastocatellia bacterium]|nr:metallophosphoesterase [Blastocatellia bacterium]
MKLVVFSDLHLDSAFAWAGSGSQAARRRRDALRSTLRRVLDLAWTERADAVLCGGDLYEHDRFTPDTASFLQSCFDKVYPLRIFIAPGNHDFYATESLYNTVQWSPNVKIFISARLEPVELEDGLTLWGGAHLAPASTGNFLQGFSADRGGVNIALFHGSELGTFGQQGESKSPHAPFREQEIGRAGIAHAFLGHYHLPRDGEHHTYPGNPDPLSFGETGARGAVVASIGPDGSVERSRRRVASTQLHDVKADVTGCSNRQEVRERVESVLSSLRGVARVTVDGELSREVDIRESDLLGLPTALDGYLVRLGKMDFAYDFASLAAEPTVRGEFVKDVMGSDLSEDERRRVLLAGLRALEGRDDLEVV